MSWINRLEARFGHWAIPGLLRYIAALNALSFVLLQISPDYLDFLVLDSSRLLKGEVWRLITYIFIPALGGFLPNWLIMALYVMYLIWIGDGLEQAWGAFRLNLYYLLGMAGTTVAALISNGDPSGSLLHASLLFAFARCYPDQIIMFMLVLPVKVKWMAWLTAAIVLLNFILGDWAFRLATIAALTNYVLFFGREILEDARNRKQIQERRARFERDARRDDGEAMHRCKVCARTELIAPELEFRVAADGEEYCTEHLPGRVKTGPEPRA
jgi:hypothetical protein